MGPIHCPETSVKDYQSTLRNIPEERRCQDYWTDVRDFLLFQNPPTPTQPPPPPLFNGTEAQFPTGTNWPRRNVYHSPASSSKVI
jgi:hypothetical protein